MIQCPKKEAMLDLKSFRYSITWWNSPTSWRGVWAAHWIWPTLSGESYQTVPQYLSTDTDLPIFLTRDESPPSFNMYYCNYQGIRVLPLPITSIAIPNCEIFGNLQDIIYVKTFRLNLPLKQLQLPLHHSFWIWIRSSTVQKEISAPNFHC